MEVSNDKQWFKYWCTPLPLKLDANPPYKEDDDSDESEEVNKGGWLGVNWGSQELRNMKESKILKILQQQNNRNYLSSASALRGWSPQSFRVRKYRDIECVKQL